MLDRDGLPAGVRDSPALRFAVELEGEAIARGDDARVDRPLGPEDHDRPGPHDLAQGVGAPGVGELDGRARELERGRPSHERLAFDHVVADQRVVGPQRLAKPQLRDRRLVRVDQGVQAGRAQIGVEGDPVALLGERIQGRPDPAQTGASVVRRPVDLSLVEPPPTRVAQLPAANELGELAARGVAPQDRDELGARARENREAPLERLATDLQRVAQGVEGHARDLDEVGRRAGVGAQAILVAGRQHEQHGLVDALLGRGSIGIELGLGRLLDHEVSVGAAGAERAQARPPRPRAPGPGPELALHHEGHALKVDVGVELRGMERGREGLMTQLKQDLGQASDARRGLEVTDVGLDRADRPLARLGLRTVAVGAAEPRDLDWIPERGPGPMGLDVVDVGRREAGLVHRRLDHPGLGPRTRHGVAVGPTAMVEGAAADQPEDPVAVCTRLRVGLEQHGADALTGHVAIAALAEAPAPTIRGQEPTLTEKRVLVGVDRHVDATGDRERGLPAAQALAGQVNGRERGRAHGVEGEARPGQVEGIGHPVGDRRERRRGQRAPPAEQIQGPVELVLAVHHADVDADGLTGERAAAIAGVLDRVPGRLQEQSLLRVHELGVTRRDPEEQRIEAIDMAEEAAPARVRATERRRVGVIPAPVIPALGGDVRDTVTTVPEVGPKRVEIVGLWIATGDPDDRNGPALTEPALGRRAGSPTPSRARGRGRLASR
ncbi:hypothetical protein DB30_03027 [Enhygromyxa salina]|uniref:Uncharacterized protein n=1 Tax=Enhygromyxa salina TaxID=215803 RepID=A0A0C2CUS1_9BACT|nr:hypothetical protein DB30_03027 [Enhygromyxa salina]